MTGAQTTPPRVVMIGRRRGIGRAIPWAFVENRYDIPINGIVEDALARGDFGFSTGSVVHVDGGLHIHRL